MNDFQLNDTFDNFTFTTAERIVQNEGGAVVANAPIKLQRIYHQSNNVSFDDSIFLNSSCSFSSFTNTSLNIEDFGDTRATKKCSNEPSRSSLLLQSGDDEASTRDFDTTSNYGLSKSDLPSNDEEASKRDFDTTNNDDLSKSNLPTATSIKLDFNSQDTPHSSNDDSLGVNINLSSWGLPDAILQKYDDRRITQMFPWQVECLTKPGILSDHKNLVYSAPTSAGKTLVAEILAIKTVLERRKKVIFILPFVSVVREKMFYFQDILGASGVRVEGFMGSYNPPGGFRKVQVAVCTIEKANSLVNRLLEEKKLGDIGAVVVDEMHLLGDPSRGYLLELLLTKLRYMSLKDEDVNIQIIGMSATLPNLKLLADWLDAELFTTEFRPIPLHEQCIVQGEVYDREFKLRRKLVGLPELETDTDNVLQLCLETIQLSCSVLIFCPSKNWCENLAQQIASAFWKLGTGKGELGVRLRDELNTGMIAECLEQLKRCPVGLDQVLGRTVSFGVAFHHAGLTVDERDIVEGGFRRGSVRVLIATSTLSSGVNLPARRVIIRSPMFNGKPMDTLTYRQMIGRAGRMGKDTEGESILICQKNDYRIAKELMSAHLRPIESCLEGAGKLKRAILEVITSDVASSPEEIELFTRCTLLASGTEITTIEDSIAFLIDNEFIRLQSDKSRYVATSLAKACLSSSLPPEEGLALFTELEKARQCFVLETELHLIYLVTPYSHHVGNIDWMVYLEMWEKLPASMKRVGELVGVRVSYILNGTRGKIQANTAKLYHKLQVHKRFYTALALQDLVNEVPLNLVADKFGCNRGMLQSLQQSAATFAGMVTSFSKQLGWSSVEILVAQFQDRLQFGISRDLLDLMRLPLLNGQRARILFNAGVESLVDLANTDAHTLENVLHKAKPFETEKEREGETAYDADKRNKLRTVWVTGKQGLTEKEAAELLIKDARVYLQLELGLREAHWEDERRTSVNEELELGLREDERQSVNREATKTKFGSSSEEEREVVLEERRLKSKCLISRENVRNREITSHNREKKTVGNDVKCMGNKINNSVSSEGDTEANRGKPAISRKDEENQIVQNTKNNNAKSMGHNSVASEEDASIPKRNRGKPAISRKNEENEIVRNTNINKAKYMGNNSVASEENASIPKKNRDKPVISRKDEENHIVQNTKNNNAKSMGHNSVSSEEDASIPKKNRGKPAISHKNEENEIVRNTNINNAKSMGHNSVASEEDASIKKINKGAISLKPEKKQIVADNAKRINNSVSSEEETSGITKTRRFQRSKVTPKNTDNCHSVSSEEGGGIDKYNCHSVSSEEGGRMDKPEKQNRRTRSRGLKRAASSEDESAKYFTSNKRGGDVAGNARRQERRKSFSREDEVSDQKKAPEEARNNSISSEEDTSVPKRNRGKPAVSERRKSFSRDGEVSDEKVLEDDIAVEARNNSVSSEEEEEEDTPVPRRNRGKPAVSRKHEENQIVRNTKNINPKSMGRNSVSSEEDISIPRRNRGKPLISRKDEENQIVRNTNIVGNNSVSSDEETSSTVRREAKTRKLQRSKDLAPVATKHSNNYYSVSSEEEEGGNEKSENQKMRTRYRGLKKSASSEEEEEGGNDKSGNQNRRRRYRGLKKSASSEDENAKNLISNKKVMVLEGNVAGKARCQERRKSFSIEDEVSDQEGDFVGKPREEGGNGKSENQNGRTRYRGLKKSASSEEEGGNDKSGNQNRRTRYRGLKKSASSEEEGGNGKLGNQNRRRRYRGLKKSASSEEEEGNDKSENQNRRTRYLVLKKSAPSEEEGNDKSENQNRRTRYRGLKTSASSEDKNAKHLISNKKVKVLEGNVAGKARCRNRRKSFSREDEVSDQEDSFVGGKAGRQEIKKSSEVSDQKNKEENTIRETASNEEMSEQHFSSCFSDDDIYSESDLPEQVNSKGLSSISDRLRSKRNITEDLKDEDGVPVKFESKNAIRLKNIDSNVKATGACGLKSAQNKIDLNAKRLGRNLRRENIDLNAKNGYDKLRKKHERVLNAKDALGCKINLRQENLRRDTEESLESKKHLQEENGLNAKENASDGLGCKINLRQENLRRNVEENASDRLESKKNLHQKNGLNAKENASDGLGSNINLRQENLRRNAEENASNRLESKKNLHQKNCLNVKENASDGLGCKINLRQENLRRNAEENDSDRLESKKNLQQKKGLNAKEKTSDELRCKINLRQENLRRDVEENASDWLESKKNLQQEEIKKLNAAGNCARSLKHKKNLHQKKTSKDNGSDDQENFEENGTLNQENIKMNSNSSSKKNLQQEKIINLNAAGNCAQSLEHKKNLHQKNTSKDNGSDDQEENFEENGTLNQENIKMNSNSSSQKNLQQKNVLNAPEWSGRKMNLQQKNITDLNAGENRSDKNKRTNLNAAENCAKTSYEKNLHQKNINEENGCDDRGNIKMDSNSEGNGSDGLTLNQENVKMHFEENGVKKSLRLRKSFFLDKTMGLKQLNIKQNSPNHNNSKKLAESINEENSKFAQFEQNRTGNSPKRINRVNSKFAQSEENRTRNSSKQIKSINQANSKFAQFEEDRTGNSPKSMNRVNSKFAQFEENHTGNSSKQTKTNKQVNSKFAQFEESLTRNSPKQAKSINRVNFKFAQFEERESSAQNNDPQKDARRIISVEIEDEELEISMNSSRDLNFSIEEVVSNNVSISSNHQPRVKEEPNASGRSLFEESFDLDSKLFDDIEEGERRNREDAGEICIDDGESFNLDSKLFNDNVGIVEGERRNKEDAGEICMDDRESFNLDSKLFNNNVGIEEGERRNEEEAGEICIDDGESFNLDSKLFNNNVGIEEGERRNEEDAGEICMDDGESFNLDSKLFDDIEEGERRNREDAGEICIDDRESFNLGSKLFNDNVGIEDGERRNKKEAGEICIDDGEIFNLDSKYFNDNIDIEEGERRNEEDAGEICIDDRESFNVDNKLFNNNIHIEEDERRNKEDAGEICMDDFGSQFDTNFFENISELELEYDGVKEKNERNRNMQELTSCEDFDGVNSAKSSKLDEIERTKVNSAKSSPETIASSEVKKTRSTTASTDNKVRAPSGATKVNNVKSSPETIGSNEIKRAGSTTAFRDNKVKAPSGNTKANSAKSKLDAVKSSKLEETGSTKVNIAKSSSETIASIEVKSTTSTTVSRNYKVKAPSGNIEANSAKSSPETIASNEPKSTRSTTASRDNKVNAPSGTTKVNSAKSILDEVKSSKLEETGSTKVNSAKSSPETIASIEVKSTTSTTLSRIYKVKAPSGSTKANIAKSILDQVKSSKFEEIGSTKVNIAKSSPETIASNEVKHTRSRTAFRNNKVKAPSGNTEANSAKSSPETIAGNEIKRAGSTAAFRDNRVKAPSGNAKANSAKSILDEVKSSKLEEIKNVAKSSPETIASNEARRTRSTNDKVKAPSRANNANSDEQEAIRIEVFEENQFQRLKQPPEDPSNFSLDFNTKLLEDISQIERDNLDVINTSSGSNEEAPKSRKRPRASISTDDVSSPMKKPKLAQAKKTQRSSSMCIDTTYIISTEKSTLGKSVIREEEEEFADFSKFEIIDVRRDEKLFECFRNELLLQKEFALSLGCERIAQDKPLIGIKVKTKDAGEDFVCKGVKLKGLSVCWGENTAYYMDFSGAVADLLRGVLEAPVRVKIFDAKEQIKVLKQCGNVDFNCSCDDPKVADWLLDPEGREKNLQALTVTYAPEAIKVCQMAGNAKGVGSVGLDLHNSIDARFRCSIESVVTWHLANPLKRLLREQDEGLLHTHEIEMNCLIILSKMELTGFGVNVKEFQTLSEKIKDYTGAIETKAFQIAGRRFSFASSADVAKVLGIYRGKKVSTNKKALHQNESPISILVLLWRRLNSALTKMVYPLLRLSEGGRIHGRHVTHSSTGRITMQEPSLQNMPRDFEFAHPLSGQKVWLSCRRAFCARDRSVLVSADYCQLELRLLAHFSRDAVLCAIMRTDEDVFESIAAKWNGISRGEVTDLIRQQTKQICYGIIYGMGAKTLAEQLCVEEDEALEFTETFHQKYPGIKEFINATVAACRESGYVQTIAGRRRYLPYINDSNLATRSQAERQAVNTVIQGSAADIVKNVMTLIEDKVKGKFRSSRNKPKMVLHLHDELMYEVPSKYLEVFSKLLRRCMQDTVKLSVPFPVKVKSGPTWGDMKDYAV